MESRAITPTARWPLGGPMITTGVGPDCPIAYTGTDFSREPAGSQVTNCARPFPCPAAAAIWVDRAARRPVSGERRDGQTPPRGTAPRDDAGNHGRANAAAGWTGFDRNHQNAAAGRGAASRPRLTGTATRDRAASRTADNRDPRLPGPGNAVRQRQRHEHGGGPGRPVAGDPNPSLNEPRPPCSGGALG